MLFFFQNYIDVKILGTPDVKILSFWESRNFHFHFVSPNFLHYGNVKTFIRLGKFLLLYYDADCVRKEYW